MYVCLSVQRLKKINTTVKPGEARESTPNQVLANEVRQNEVSPDEVSQNKVPPNKKKN